MSRPTEDSADVGLLSPVSVGTAAEALTSDRAVLQAMLAFEASLARALTEHRLAPAVEMPAREPDPRTLARDAVPPGNPTVPLLAALRAGMDEDHGRAVHRGATSQDVVDTALMVVSSAVLRDVRGSLVGLSGELVRLAEEHRAVPCVARTLTQQAMPTTLGFRVAGWLAGVHDALELVRAALPLPVSVGGPVGTAAAYGAAGPAVAASVASELGLVAPVLAWHSRRTPLLRVATALLAAGEACGRISADVLLMSQTEVGEASDGSGGASSAMPHKSNPTRAVLVASAVQQLPMLAATLTSSGSGASERPPGEWHAEWAPLRTMLRLAGAATERTVDLVTDLAFDTRALQRNLDLLVAATGGGPEWVAEQTAHVGLWVDRVLARQREGAR